MGSKEHAVTAVRIERMENTRHSFSNPKGLAFEADRDGLTPAALEAVVSAGVFRVAKPS